MLTSVLKIDLESTPPSALTVDKQDSAELLWLGWLGGEPAAVWSEPLMIDLRKGRETVHRWKWKSPMAGPLLTLAQDRLLFYDDNSLWISHGRITEKQPGEPFPSGPKTVSPDGTRLAWSPSSGGLYFGTLRSAGRRIQALDSVPGMNPKLTRPSLCLADAKEPGTPSGISEPTDAANDRLGFLPFG